MSDDLVKRLRSCLESEYTYDPDKDEAADRIEALTKERDTLRDWDDYFRKMLGYKRDGRPSPECLDEWLDKVLK